MNIVRSSMEHPVTVTMVTLAAVLFGAVSLSRLPWNLLPEISYPTLTLRTEYTDAAPAEIENLVTAPIEQAVAVVRGLRNLRSASRAGISEITLEFGWDTDMDYAALDVREKVDLVTLPDDAEVPVLLRYDPNLDPILRIGLHGEKDLVTLRYLAERVLKKELESLEGVASARVRGGLEEEIQVEVDEGKLAALGIPITAVAQFLDSQNVNASGGSLRDRDAEFLVRTLNEFADVEEIGRTVLYEEDGRRVTLADVSVIRRGYKDREMVTRVRGTEAVEVAIYKEGDANTVQVARAVKKRLARIDNMLPKNVETQILADQSIFLEQSVNEVKSNAIVGGLLAIFVLYLFLKDRRSTLIIALTIPTSVAATFLVMQQLGVSLNLMSLGGLALGIGNLVDNAIVVLESVARHRAMGKPVWEATVDGAGEVARAVTASTFTTVAVFVPIIFVEGIAGQIFRDQALTVTASQILSLLAGLTLIPVLASLAGRKSRSLPAGAPTVFTEPEVSRPPQSERKRRWLVRALRRSARVLAVPLLWISRTLTVLVPGFLIKGIRFLDRVVGRSLSFVMRPIHAAFDRSWMLLDRGYPRLLEAALARRGLTILAAIVLMLAGVALFPLLGTELVPPFSQGEFLFDLELPSGTPLQITEATVQQIEHEIGGDPRIRVFSASVGVSPEFGSAAGQKRENVAQIAVAVKNPGNPDQETAVIETIRRSLAKHPEIRSTFRRPTFFSFQTPVEVVAYGHDIDQLRDYTQQLTTDLALIRGLRDVRSSVQEGNPEVQISFQRDRVAALDLDLESISRTLRNTIHGEVATRLKERDRQLDILVRASNAGTFDVEQVRGLAISNAGGIPVPLSAVADVTVGRGPAEITRLGQQRAAVVRADLVGRDLGSATREIREVLRRNPPPANIVADIGGQNDEIAVSFKSLVLAGILAIFMVYLVMASEFESFLHPFVILLTVPLGLVGVVFSLAATGTSISVVVLIGVILLCGIVVNNAIVLIDFVNQRRREGMAKVEAVIDAGRTRLRPIIMTTATTVLGLLPMAIGLGEGAEIRAPMAIAVTGGLTLATLLTLVVIPVVYVSLDRKP